MQIVNFVVPDLRKRMHVKLVLKLIQLVLPNVCQQNLAVWSNDILGMLKLMLGPRFYRPRLSEKILNADLYSFSS